MKSFRLLVLATGLAACEIRPADIQVADTTPYWRSKEPVEFSMAVSDTSTYRINLLIRNRSDYPWSRFFTSVVIRDSAGSRLDSLLAQMVLFDPVTGKPGGKSGLGDIYDHELTVREGWKTAYTGKVTIRLAHMMRVDSLTGIVSAGIRLQAVGPQGK